MFLQLSHRRHMIENRDATFSSRTIRYVFTSCFYSRFLLPLSPFFSLFFSLLCKVYIKHNSLGDDIPIVVVLKAMGLECDEEIVQLVGTESEILDLFSGSLEEPYYLGIYSQDQVGNPK